MEPKPSAAQQLPRPRLAWPMWLLVLALGAGLGAGGMHLAHDRARNIPDAPADSAQDYHCPMHPTYRSGQPGDCPICGMKLAPVAKAEDAIRKPRFYRSPMDPRQTSPVPAKDEMGMDFVAVYDAVSATDAAAMVTPVAGMVEVRFSPERLQLLGVRTAMAETGPVADSVQTTVRLTPDETRVYQVTLKVDAYVEKVHAGVVGELVRKGQPLLTVFSPELLAAQGEYAAAARGAVSSGQVDLAAASAEKLRLWNVPQASLFALAHGSKPQRTVTFDAPMTGTLTRREVVEGSRLSAGAMAMQLTDLKRLWALADLRTDDIAKVHPGMKATVRLLAYPGRTFVGTVDVMEPGIDPETRALRVRIGLKNDDGTLYPEMYGDVELRGEAHDAVTVPSDALMDSGNAQVVLVASATPGAFVPRQVHVGVHVGQRVEIVDGLRAGERVVTRANFLIDSESRLKAALSAMTPESP